MSYLTNNPQTFKGDIVVPGRSDVGESRVVNFAADEQFKFYFTPTTIQNDYWSPSTGGQNISSYNKSTGVLTVNKLVATDPNGASYFPIVYTKLTAINNGSTIAPGAILTLTSGFSLTAGHTYRVTTSPMSFYVGSGVPATTDNVVISFGGAGSTPVVLGSVQVNNINTDASEVGAPLVCIFKALNTPVAPTIVLQAYNGSGSTVTYGQNVNTLFMLEDLGTSF